MDRAPESGGSGRRSGRRNGKRRHNPNNSISDSTSSSSSSTALTHSHQGLGAPRPPPLPFPIIPADTRALRIFSPPLKVEMPVLSASLSAAINGTSLSLGGKDDGRDCDSGKDGSKSAFESAMKELAALTDFDIQMESYAYPAWDRCKVEVVGANR